MIPLKLQLTNFMCYRGRDYAIELEGIHLAALTGDNGQGKSALLDAMTWALWGKARSSRADDLVTYGETEMRVVLDFALADDRYRVVRMRTTSGRGSSGLELFIFRRDGTLKALTDPSIRETQARITKALRLDYDTFINASFLIQGRADEFTTRSPGERKQILADILGLAQFDQLASRARERARSLEEERRRVADELTQIAEQVAQIPELEAAVVEADSAAQAEAARVSEAMERHQALIEERRALEAKAEQRLHAEQRIQEARREMVRLSQLIEGQRAKLQQYDRLIARADEIGTIQQQLAAAREAKAHWDERLNQSLRLKSDASELQRQVEQARAEVERERHAADTRARAASATITRLHKKSGDLHEAQEQLRLLTETRERREADQTELARQAEEQGELRAENSRLKEAMDELVERIALLKGSDEATCPVCRRPLSVAARAQALEEAEAEGKAMGDRYRANKDEVKRGEGVMKALRATIESAGRQLGTLQEWQRRAADAASAAAEVSNAEQLLAAAEAERTSLAARLEANDYARDAQQKLARIATESEAIGYDSAAHDAARATIQQYQPREREVQELQQAQEQRPLVDELLRAQQGNHERAQEQLAQAEREVAELTQALQEQERILREIREASHALSQAQQSLAKAQRDVGAQRQRLEYAEQHAARQPEVQKRYDQVAIDKGAHDQLAYAFGKQGIQAMLIDSALPEIEQEANRLLDRMTDGRMSVHLKTQREGKTTDAPIETLDIEIADESGERAYETFSGGESFRINFALRIALSKLLANRSGANLRTLIMDEGFGSQDAKGRERLIEAITSVQEDFDRILVITHIDELKEAFPVRLDVVKGDAGSRVFVR